MSVPVDVGPPADCLRETVNGDGVSMCEGGEGWEGLKWFNMHVIVFVTSRAFK